MQAVIRNYIGQGPGAFFDLLEQRQAEVEALLKTVPGLVSYVLARSHTGGFSVTICRDQAGIERSTEMVKEWVAHNASTLAVDAPRISTGRVIARIH